MRFPPLLRSSHAASLRSCIETLEGRIAPAVFVVNSTLDLSDSFLDDGIADTANNPTTMTPPSGITTLRAAIQQANHNPGPDEIHFNIGGGGHQVITTQSFPTVIGALVINGATQPGFAGTPIIELRGMGAGSLSGLELGGANSTIRGLVINNFTGGIFISGDNNTIVGNFIGTDVTGTMDRGNIEDGVYVASGSGNTIGGAAAADRNVISGNGRYGVYLTGIGAVLKNNNIGTDVTGTLALGNGDDGVHIHGGINNIVGGTGDNEGNLISGNGVNGVRIHGHNTTGNQVINNLIGTKEDAITPLPNTNAGVHIESRDSGSGGDAPAGFEAVTGNIIGGVTDQHGNVISGNLVNGVLISGLGATGNFVQANFIGTDFTGGADVGNGQSGVFIDGAPSNTIGGPGGLVGAGNLISGNNGSGVQLAGANTTGNIVDGNRIGSTANGLLDLPNELHGVLIDSGASSNLIGSSDARNVISGNKQAGVLIRGATTTANTLEANFIGTTRNGDARLPNTDGVRIELSGSNVIGGINAGEGNVISGNNNAGILITGATATDNAVQGNFIGTNAAGTAVLENDGSGVVITSAANDNTIGDTAAGGRNIISGNMMNGVEITAGATNNKLLGNTIGLDAAGTAKLPNQLNGVLILSSASNRIGGSDSGEANIISGNTGNGVVVKAVPGNPAATGNLISRNSIFANGKLGIDLVNDLLAQGATINDAGDADVGGNNLQNSIEIIDVRDLDANTRVRLAFAGTPGANYTIEFFTNSFDNDTSTSQGQTFLAEAAFTLNASGMARFGTTLPGNLAAKEFLTATIRDAAGNTSEFYQDRDGDGLPDSWEADGLDADGDGTVDLDLPALGAKPDHKDLFVEIDYMETDATHSHRPVDADLMRVKVAFEDAPIANPDNIDGITLHTFVGDDVPHVAAIFFPERGPGAQDDFEDFKSAFFGTVQERIDPNKTNILEAKRQVFRYCLYGHQFMLPDMNGVFRPVGNAGRGELGGNDFIVTLGDTPAATLKALDIGAGTFMHELGHTLGLQHGGVDDINHKPNYLSVMSYSLLDGRYYPGRPLEYSADALPTLNETSLDEMAGIGGFLGKMFVYAGKDPLSNVRIIDVATARGPVDWNFDKDTNDIVTDADPNFLDTPSIPAADGKASPGQELKGHDDWSNLQYGFRSAPGFANGADTIFPSEPETIEDILAAADSFDFDGDGFSNLDDNNPGSYNPAQVDKNADGIGDPVTTMTLMDIDGDLIKVSRKGAGTLNLVFDDPDQDGDGEIVQINLDGGTAKTSLTISVKKRPGGDGFITIGSIAGDALKILSAKAPNITGGIAFDGYLGSVTVRDLLNGAAIEADAGVGKQRTKINAHIIGDGSVLNIGGPISSLTAAQIGDAEINAPSIGSIVVKGDRKLLVTGSFEADVMLSGAGLATGGVALGSLKAASISGSEIFAGFTPANLSDPVAGGVFSGDFLIKSIRTTGLVDSFADSVIAASRIGTARFASVDTTNGGDAFGILAHQSAVVTAIKSVISPVLTYDRLGNADQFVDDFHIKRLA